MPGCRRLRGGNPPSPHATAPGNGSRISGTGQSLLAARPDHGTKPPAAWSSPLALSSASNLFHTSPAWISILVYGRSHPPVAMLASLEEEAWAMGRGRSEACSHRKQGDFFRWGRYKVVMCKKKKGDFFDGKEKWEGRLQGRRRYKVGLCEWHCFFL